MTEAAEDEAREQVLDALIKELDEGKITMKEYNARRRAILRGDAAPPKEEKKPDVAPAPADGAAPPGWSLDQKKKAGTKTWSAGARTDDPTVRQVHQPLQKGIGEGKVIYFLFGFRRSAQTDQQMLAREIEQIQDDIQVLREGGYTVVVDPQATKKDFLDAVHGEGEGAAGLAPAMLYWSAHGHADGSLETCDGGQVTFADVDTSKVHGGLRLAVLAACYVGAHSGTWKKTLGGRPLVVGWGRPVTIDRAVEFLKANPETETDLDDLIARYLLADNPLPGEPNGRHSPLEPKQGRIEDLPERIKNVSTMLGARWRPHDKTVEVDVPLPERRSHYVHVSVVDSQHPFSEGEPLLAVEGDVGEITAVVDPPMLLAGFSDPGYARVSLVKGEHDMPRIVVQGFLPLARVRDTDLAALIYQVALVADELEKRVFGGDMR